MTTLINSFIVECNSDLWNKAIDMAKKRIKTEYKRDVRLNKEERIEKIAIGYIGEFIFKKWCEKQNLKEIYLGKEVTNCPDNGDFLINNYRIDVKTQEIFYSPQDDWRCEVTSDQINRPIEIYVFSKLYNKNNTKKLYLIGWLTKKDFLKNAKFRKEGTLLKGKRVHYPKYDVTIEQLEGLSSLKEFVGGKL
jgi:hypothetical protein